MNRTSSDTNGDVVDEEGDHEEAQDMIHHR